LLGLLIVLAGLSRPFLLKLVNLPLKIVGALALGSGFLAEMQDSLGGAGPLGRLLFAFYRLLLSFGSFAFVQLFPELYFVVRGKVVVFTSHLRLKNPLRGSFDGGVTTASR
jgi:hypothetical protein